MASRETQSIWFRLKPCIIRKHEYWTRRMAIREFYRWLAEMPFNRWQRRYFWHDNVGRYFNRWLICPIFGHQKVLSIEDGEGGEYPHCFGCERKLNKEDG